MKLFGGVAGVSTGRAAPERFRRFLLPSYGSIRAVISKRVITTRRSCAFPSAQFRQGIQATVRRGDHSGSLRLVALLAAWLSACGGGGDSSPPPPPPISVSVSPATASVFLGATQSFTATVTNASNSGVFWSVSGAGCTGMQCGTIDTNGLYTAPPILPSPGTITIRATSQANASRVGTATVTLTSDVSVSAMPAATSVELGASFQLTATVAGSGNPDRNVTWEVSCGAPCGTVTSAGLYTAPSILPSPATVMVTARSVADTSKTSSATITITSNFALALSGPSTLDTGATGQFTATVTPVPGSNPSTDMDWSVNGISGGDTTVGTITAAGLYTTPLLAPAPNLVTITATSRADPSKSVSAGLTINNVISVAISPSPAVGVALEASQQFTATVTGTPNTTVIWDVNGIVGGDQATTGAISQSGLYFAPVNKPASAVTVRATSQADSTKFATVTVDLFSTIQIQITPAQATRAVSHLQTLGIAVQNTSNARVQWRVDGVAGGDAVKGMICVSGFAPCQPISGFTSDPTVDYLAPASVASDLQVTITATSEADPLASGSVQMTVIPAVRVIVLPANSTLPATGRQSLLATVLGTDDQRVTWAVNGIANGDATVGMICTAGSNPCAAPSGPLAGSVEYLAPAAAPGPGPITITATSAEDPAQSGSGTVTISTGPFIQTLQPGSFFATDGSSLTLRVHGLNFAAGASTILFNGSPRATNCVSATQCATQLSATDYSTAGDKAVQVENPGTPPVLSNQVVLRVVQPDTTEDVIPLTVAAPNATSKDILVVEPFAANASGVKPDIETVGIFVMTSCNASGISIAVTRPAPGDPDKLVRICINGEGFDANSRVSISGPNPNDIGISNVQSFGFGFDLTLTLRGTTLPGPRTLFVETGSKEKVAATAAIEVK